MAGFTNKHRNLERITARFSQDQVNYFELLKLQGRNVSQFIRVAVDRAIDQEKNRK